MSFTDDVKTGMGPYRDQIKQLLDFLFHYIRNPIQTIKNVPDWPWPQLLICFVAIAAITGTVAGILSLRFSEIIFGLILFPISSLIGGALLSGFYYYTFMFVFQKQTAFKTLFTIVTLSLIPFFALYTLSKFVPLLQLVGFAVSGLLMIVGLTESTQIDRKKIIKLVAGLYLVYALMTIINMINWERENKSYKDIVTPDSVELLKKEFEQ